jgi:hypothetical protein
VLQVPPPASRRPLNQAVARNPASPAGRCLARPQRAFRFGDPGTVSFNLAVPRSGRIERVNVRIVACTSRGLRRRGGGASEWTSTIRSPWSSCPFPCCDAMAKDIPALARELARRSGERLGKPDARLPSSLIGALCEEEWPGNVRQGEHLARAVSSGSEIDIEVLSSSRTDSGTGRQSRFLSWTPDGFVVNIPTA